MRWCLGTSLISAAGLPLPFLFLIMGMAEEAGGAEEEGGIVIAGLSSEGTPMIVW